MYETFRRFQIQQTQPGHILSPKQAWLDIANEILGKSHTNITKTMDNLNHLIVSTNFYNNVRKVKRIKLLSIEPFFYIIFVQTSRNDKTMEKKSLK